MIHQTIENVIDNPSPVKVHLAISLERPQGKIQIDKGKNINKDENINNHHQTTTAYRLRGRLARLDIETALERMMMGASIYWRGQLSNSFRLSLLIEGEAYSEI